MPAEYLLILVTCGSAKEARRVSTALVRKRLAACVNITTNPVTSVYSWKGKVETATEVLMLIKTTRKRFAGLEREIHSLHSYKTPEIIALPITAGSQSYLKWLRESLDG